MELLLRAILKVRPYWMERIYRDWQGVMDVLEELAGLV
jgi:hypothetical protein